MMQSLASVHGHSACSLLFVGATHFSFSMGGDVNLAKVSILQKCGNDARKYMEEVVTPLLQTHGFQPVVTGDYRPISLQLDVRRGVVPGAAYTVTGDTGYVHFEKVYDFKLGKWNWDKGRRAWHMSRSIIDSACGYNKDEQAPLRQLTAACAGHMGGAVNVLLHR